MRFVRRATAFLFALVLCASLVPAKQVAQAQPIRPGDPFPAGTYPNLNGEGSIDLSTYLGKKPVLLLYWVAGHPRADESLTRVQALADELGSDKIAILAVAIQRPGREKADIIQRLEELEIKLPVIDDEGFRLGQQLQVQAVGRPLCSRRRVPEDRFPRRPAVATTDERPSRTHLS